MEIRRFEWIFRQFKEEIRRLSSAKSRVDDAEMAEKTPKLRIKEFLRHSLIQQTIFLALRTNMLCTTSSLPMPVRRHSTLNPAFSS